LEGSTLPTWCVRGRAKLRQTDRVMPSERNLQQDLTAIALAALVVFLGLSLATYHPADPPVNLIAPFDKLQSSDNLVYPPDAKYHNACGRVGHLVADVLFQATGFGAYFLVASLAVLDYHLLRRRLITHPWLRAVGWGMAFVGVTTVAALLLPRTSPGPVIGAGGYLGASGRGLLEMNFATAGAYILTTSVILSGLILCTDYFVLHVFNFTITALTLGLVRNRTQDTATNAGVNPLLLGEDADDYEDEDEEDEDDDDDEDEDDEDDAESGMQVKIRNKRLAAIEEEDDDDDDDDDDDESAAAGTQPAISVSQPAVALGKAAAVANATPAAVAAQSAAPTLTERLASALRIKNLNKNDAEHDAMRAELEAASRENPPRAYQLPPLDLLLPGEMTHSDEHEQEVRQKAKILEKTFANFGFSVKVVEIETGPVIAQYEVELEAGLRLSRITGLADDLAIALRVPSVRIVAPIPGKNTVGIEVPNNERQIVRMREVIEESTGKAKKMRIPIFLGKDVAGNPLVADLTSLPHLLIAGRTGTGKSVCLNTIICSMLMSRGPDDVKMLMIDPKMVELSPYKRLPHLMHPVVTDMRKAEAILGWAVEKMEERYSLLARAGVRHISVYNQLGEEELMQRLQPENDEQAAEIPRHLPYIVIVADEMADLMMTAPKEVEQHIIRLAQKSRAVGIHLILATQKPTVDVITGLIKSNLPARIAFQVASRVDSRVVLDEMGADKLLGNGDMLFLWPGTSQLLRGQGTYLSDDEINRVMDFVGVDNQQFVKELVQLKPKNAEDAKKILSRDEMYEAAVDVVIREGRGSVSLLQRALGIGYGRAARLIDFMAEDGIVGEYKGSQAREVLITIEQWYEMTGQSGQAADEPKPSKKSNKIVVHDDPEEDETPIAAAILDEEETDDSADEDEEAESEYDEADTDAWSDAEADEESDDADDEDEEDEDEEDEDEEDEDDDEEYDEDEEGEIELVEEPRVRVTPRREGRDTA